MNKTYTIIGGIVGFLVLIGLFIGGSYNSLVGAQTKVEQAQSKIETTLQRRYDLIPNVVNSVKGYMKHESDIFEHIADARAKIGSSTATKAELDSAISRLLVVQENYPQLKADQQVQNLITELEGTENRIFVARNDYNEVATKYNNKIRRFPSNIMANMFGFEKVELVKADEKAKTTVPSVDLNN